MPEISTWLPIGDFGPGDSGAFSSDNPDGTHKVYVFKCAEDGSYSTITEATLEAEAEIRNQTVLMNSIKEVEPLKELKAGEECTLDIRAGASYEKMTIRFSHSGE